MAYVLAGYWAAGYVEETQAEALPGVLWVWARPYEADPKRAAKDARLRTRNRERWQAVEQAIYDAVREVEIAPVEAVKSPVVPQKVKAAAVRLMPDFGDAGRAAERISDLMDAIWRDSLERARIEAESLRLAAARAAQDEDEALFLLMVA